MSDRPRIIPGFDAFLHGGDYNPDQWLTTPEVIDRDFELMPKAGCNAFSVGIFAWTMYEREEGKYTFDWLDDVMGRIAGIGGKAILATPSGARPAWMARKYEEVRRVDRQGLREPYQGRHNHCWTSPIYRAKVEAINTRLAERYKDHPALGMWHLSNEYSGECYCPLCVGRFREWVREKYGSIEALNEAWWTGFWSHQVVDWEDIEPRDHVLEGMMLDWMRFNSWQVGDFVDFEAAPLRRITPGVPVTTNFMGFHEGIDYRDLARHLDVITDDQYPAYSPFAEDLPRSAAYTSLKDDMYRCFKPDRPWMLMESCPGSPQWKVPRTLKRPGLHRAEMLQAIAHGAEGTCYFQWRAGRGGLEKLHGAVVEHEGSERTQTFRDVADHSAMLTEIKDLLGTPPAEAEVALIFDWDVRWAFNLTDGVAKRSDAYVQAALDHYQPFWETGIPVDVIGTDDPLDKYKLVIAPILWMLKPGLAERLRAYVERGGTLVGTYYSFMTDESNRMLLGGWPGNGLREVFGVWNEEVDWLPEGQAAKLDSDLELTARDLRAILHAEGAEVVARYADQYYAGTPAITRHRFGEGEAWYIGARLDVPSLRELYGQLREPLDLRPVVDHAIPPGVSAHARGDWRFLINWTDQPVTVGPHSLPPFGSVVLRPGDLG